MNNLSCHVFGKLGIAENNNLLDYTCTKDQAFVVIRVIDILTYKYLRYIRVRCCTRDQYVTMIASYPKSPPLGFSHDVQIFFFFFLKLMRQCRKPTHHFGVITFPQCVPRTHTYIPPMYSTSSLCLSLFVSARKYS